MARGPGPCIIPLISSGETQKSEQIDGGHRDRSEQKNIKLRKNLDLLGVFLPHPGKLTWNLKMNPRKRRFLLETIIFRFHVSFRGGNCHLRSPPKKPATKNHRHLGIEFFCAKKLRLELYISWLQRWGTKKNGQRISRG